MIVSTVQMFLSKIVVMNLSDFFTTIHSKIHLNPYYSLVYFSGYLNVLGLFIHCICLYKHKSYIYNFYQEILEIDYLFLIIFQDPKNQKWEYQISCHLWMKKLLFEDIIYAIQH